MAICNILIADDEKLAREAIKLQLPKDGTINVVAECNNGYDALQKIAELKPGIIFLDIKMPLLTGMEVLENLPANYHPYLIIASAHDEYALQAYEHDAVDYLLKPFSDDRFKKAFTKAYHQWQLNEMHTNNAASLATTLKDVIAHTANSLSVKEGTRIHLLPYSNIVFIEAAKDYVSIHTKERKYLHKETMQQLEQTLSPAGFARIHKSYIVNTQAIKKFDSLYNGDYTVELHNGQQLKLSRNYRDNIKHLIR